MDGRFNGGNPEQEEYDTTPENSSESPPPSTSTSSKKSRRAMQKTVITLPIKEVERSRLKGETASFPPSDSWAWRKYGQKPIKGSPYPRGYYRCSSSKGCPARKQVERSSADPSMLVITYSCCEHNHPLPLPCRNHHHHHRLKAAKTDPHPEPEPEPEAEREEKFMDIADDDYRLVMSISADEFTWFGEMDTTSSAVLDCQTFAERSRSDSEDFSSMFSPMREEDESLFADLGELPECSTMFGATEI